MKCLRKREFKERKFLKKTWSERIAFQQQNLPKQMTNSVILSKIQMFQNKYLAIVSFSLQSNSVALHFKNKESVYSVIHPV